MYNKTKLKVRSTLRLYKIRVFCFIVKEDFKHFKKGDVLKATCYNAPALNSARMQLSNTS